MDMGGAIGPCDSPPPILPRQQFIGLLKGQNSGFRLLVCERYDWPKSMIIPATIYDHGPGEHILQSIAGLNNPRSQILSYGFLQNLLLLHVTLLKVESSLT